MNLLPTQNALPDLVRFSSIALLWTQRIPPPDIQALTKSIKAYWMSSTIHQTQHQPLFLCLPLLYDRECAFFILLSILPTTWFTFKYLLRWTERERRERYPSSLGAMKTDYIRKWHLCQVLKCGKVFIGRGGRKYQPPSEKVYSC